MENKFHEKRALQKAMHYFRLTIYRWSNHAVFLIKVYIIPNSIDVCLLKKVKYCTQFCILVSFEKGLLNYLWFLMKLVALNPGTINYIR
jgi:hypothetical protein